MIAGTNRRQQVLRLMHQLFDPLGRDHAGQCLDRVKSPEHDIDVGFRHVGDIAAAQMLLDGGEVLADLDGELGQ